MSRPCAPGEQPAASTDRSTGRTAAIPVGAVHVDGTVREARYDPGADVVRVRPADGGPAETITPATWVSRCRAAAVDRVARQLGELLAAGAILEQPTCATSGCPRRCTPIECARSGDHPALEAPICKDCYGAQRDELGRPPSASGADRTVDRSAVRAVRGDGPAP